MLLGIVRLFGKIDVNLHLRTLWKGKRLLQFQHLIAISPLRSNHHATPVTFKPLNGLQLPLF